MLVLLLCVQLVVQVLVSSESPPAPPQNAYVDEDLLTWTPASEEGNVTYTVQYSSFKEAQWRDVISCVQIPRNTCDVSQVKTSDPLHCVMLRVRAQRGEQSSRAVEACSRDVTFCTPSVTLSTQPGTLTVHLTRNHSLFDKNAHNARYKVYYGKEGKPLKQNYQDAMGSRSIHDLQGGQRYCAQARFVKYIDKPVGPASCPQCDLIPLTVDPPSQRGIIVAVVVVLVLGLLMFVSAYMMISHHGTIKQWLRPQPRLPDHFIFTSYHPVSISNPNEEHFDIISSVTPED